MSFTVPLSVLGVRGRRVLGQQEKHPLIQFILLPAVYKKKKSNQQHLLRGPKLTSEMGKSILLRKA